MNAFYSLNLDLQSKTNLKLLLNLQWSFVAGTKSSARFQSPSRILNDSIEVSLLQKIQSQIEVKTLCYSLRIFKPWLNPKVNLNRSPWTISPSLNHQLISDQLSNWQSWEWWRMNKMNDEGLDVYLSMIQKYSLIARFSAF
jgi:hypothetical protein